MGCQGVPRCDVPAWPATCAAAQPAPVAWIEGGVSDTAYTLTCTAVTSQGRALVATATLLVGPPGLDDPNLATPGPAA